MNIQELSAALAARKTTSVDLVKAAFKRIEETKPFNAIGVTSPKALEFAKQLDEERSIGRLRGPLHGIPVVIKDNILYQDGTPTTANSYALRDLIPPYDALIVERMIAAGAIIVAKANLSELANFLTTEGMPNGYGSMYGQVKHPYDESVDPLGSSTGSAVAVALDIVPVSIGSETNGSLMAPALYNQVVTLKPTQGVVPQHGIIPISPSQDTAGPMAKTVKDVALMMDVISGKPGGFTTRLSQPPKGKVLWLTMTGLLGDYLPSAWVDTMKALAIPRLKAIGLEVEERTITPVDIPNEQVLLAEFAPAMTAFFQTLGPDFPLQSMEDLIKDIKRIPNER
jgi:Asp-tRNAAsn/Glu-tRNAGln amidotransferase A subunit and related amidases